LRILVTSHGRHPCPGGVDTYIRSITKALEARGHAVDLLCFSNIDILPDESLVKLERIWEELVNKLGKTVGKAFLENELLRYTHEELLRHTDISKYDIIHSQFGITSHAAKRVYPEVPLVGTIHSCFYSEALHSDIVPESDKALFLRFDKQAVSCPTTVITVSSLINKEMPPIPKEKHEIIYNGIDTDVFRPKLRTKDLVRIATAGGIFHHKGYDTLIEALTLLKNGGMLKNKFELTMFGNGDGLPALRSMVEERSLPVKFAGEVSRNTLAMELPNFDIFVQPSRLDNFPFSVIEAMACGCVPIGSRVGGIPEQIDHMKNGVLVEPENILELAEALRLLIQNPLLREELGHQAWFAALNRFSLTRMGERLEEVYQKTIVKHPARHPALRPA